MLILVGAGGWTLCGMCIVFYLLKITTVKTTFRKKYVKMIDMG